MAESPLPVKIEHLRCAVDARGALCEPLDAEALQRQRNAHVVLTAPGAIRGNHRHQHSTETTIIFGPARVAYREGTEIRTAHVPDGEAWRFTFPPGVPHAYQGTGNATMVLISFNTAVHDPAAPDTERDTVLTP